MLQWLCLLACVTVIARSTSEAEVTEQDLDRGIFQLLRARASQAIDQNGEAGEKEASHQQDAPVESTEDHNAKTLAEIKSWRQPGVTVFGGLSHDNPPGLLEQCKAIGAGLAKKGFFISSAGASVGCIGEVVKGVLEEKGHAVAITVELFIKEVAPGQVTLLVNAAKDLSARKTIFKALSQVCIILPGGPGTMDELWEVMSEKSEDINGGSEKEIILMSHNDFFKPVSEQLQIMYKSFNWERYLHLVTVVRTAEEVLDLVSALPIAKEVVERSPRISHSSVEESWRHFKSKHVRLYSHPGEETFRRHAFLHGLKESSRMQALNPHASFGVGPFADWTQKEFLGKLGYDAPPSFSSIEQPVALIAEDAVDAKDWTDEGVVNPPMDQKLSSGCDAFAVTAVIEAQWKLAGHSLPKLAEEQFLSCLDMGGGNMFATATWLIHEQQGRVATKASFPFADTLATPHCHLPSTVAIGAVVTGVATVSTDEAAAASFVALYGPIYAALDAAMLQHYSGGVIEDCLEEREPNHAVAVVGFGVEDGIPYWKIKNSWGPAWGEGGFFRLHRGTNACNFKPIGLLCVEGGTTPGCKKPCAGTPKWCLNPSLPSCCGGDICCPASSTCCVSGCCAAGAKCCGKGCCNSNDICCSDGSCCPHGTQCAGDKCLLEQPWHFV